MFLPFNFHWLRTGEKEGEIVKELKKLTNTKAIFKGIPALLAMHEPDITQSISQLIKEYKKQEHRRAILKRNERNQRIHSLKMPSKTGLLLPNNCGFQAENFI